VDGIESEFEGELKVIRLNVQEPVGQTLGRKYRFEFTPTFILFDRQGEEVWRSIGVITPSEIRDLMNDL
jgi:thioredoxin-related protein